MTVTFSVYL